MFTPLILQCLWAVKDGTVISTKDDYAFSGTSGPYFLDKANYVNIMHDGDVYAIYAHLTLGSVKVEFFSILTSSA